MGRLSCFSVAVHFFLMSLNVLYSFKDGTLEKGMATHSSILAWRIPWTEELGGLQSMGLRTVGHD